MAGRPSRAGFFLHGQPLGRRALYDSKTVHPVTRLRNGLLELRPWIFTPDFGNFGALFWSIFLHSARSGLQKSIPDGLTDLRTQNESSGARLRPIFDHFRQKCERFSIFCNLNFKKSACQTLFFINKFLIPVIGCEQICSMSQGLDAFFLN